MSNVHTPSEGHDSDNEVIENLMAELGDIIGKVEKDVTWEEGYHNTAMIGESLLGLSINYYEDGTSDVTLVIHNTYGRITFEGKSEGKGKKRKTSFGMVTLSQHVAIDMLKDGNDPIVIYGNGTEAPGDYTEAPGDYYVDSPLQTDIRNKTLLTKEMLQSVIEKTRKLVERPENSELKEGSIEVVVESQIVELRKAYTAIVGNILK